MRFESLDYMQQIHFLRRLHATINREFFDGALQPITIDICNINKRYDPESDYEALACYGPEYRNGPNKIAFAHECIDFIERHPTQRDQVKRLFTIMLHEMIHQYCDENGIEQTDDGEQWQQAATAHGLDCYYEDGERQEEKLSPEAERQAERIRIRV